MEWVTVISGLLFFLCYWYDKKYKIESIIGGILTLSCFGIFVISIIIIFFRTIINI